MSAVSQRLRRPWAIVIGLFVLAAVLVAMPLIAQDQQQLSPDEQKDWLVQFVEGQLSTPERQIRISNIEGILSEDASIREITISDAEGVWLRIENAAINWNQGALLGGRLEIRSLSAERIAYLRNPVPSETSALPAPEAGGLAVPELPVAVILEDLSVPSVTFGESVFGLGSEISVAGGFTLEGGNLDAVLDVTRLDGPGGTLAVDVEYRRETQAVDIGVVVTEPENGILANLLNIEGRPPIALAVTGSGPVAELRTELTLDAGAVRVLAGEARIAQTGAGFAVDANLSGPISTLMAERYRPFFGANTVLTGSGLVHASGAVEVSQFNLTGGQLALHGSARTTADGFLRQLALEGDITSADGEPILLPVPQRTEIGGARFVIDYGAAGNEAWSGGLSVDAIATEEFAAGHLALTGSGVAAALDDPTARRLTFNADGQLSGITAASPEVAEALGDRIGFGLAGLWRAGGPVEVAELRLEGAALSLLLHGSILDAVFNGDVAIRTASMAPFSGLAGRPLSGALDLAATGTISPLNGGFDLTLDGTGTGLGLGDGVLDRLLRGDVSLSGRVTRSEQGFSAEAFRLENAQLTMTADGRFASDAADFEFELQLADLGLLSEAADGAATVTGTARGSDGRIALALEAAVPHGELVARPLRDAVLGIEGTLEANRFAGRVAGTGFLGGHRVSLEADLVQDEDSRALRDLSFETAGTVLTGSVAQDSEGLLAGQLALAAPNVETAAALLLQDASGAVEARIELSAVESVQNAAVRGTVSDLRAAGMRIAAAEIQASMADIFGIPVIDGNLNGRGFQLGGLVIERITADAVQQDGSTRFSAVAGLANAAELDLAGALAPLPEGYRLALERAVLTRGDLRAQLARPAELTVEGQQVRMDAVRFEIGGGAITASGTAGERLDVDVTIAAVPLGIANALVPQLGLEGMLSGSASITGTAAAPAASFELSGSGVSAAAVEPFGITPLQFSASGALADQIVRLSGISVEGRSGLRVTGSGTVPLPGDGLAVDLTGTAPLVLGNRFVAERGGQLSGTATLEARITGRLDSPLIRGRVATSDAGYVDPLLNLRLIDISGAAQLTGAAIEIETLRARLATGGTVAVTGALGLGDGNPADLAIRLESARYSDADLVVATLSGDLSLTGPLMRNPLLGGSVLIEEANIAVPETFGGGGGLIEVKHVRPAPAVQATLARARHTESRGGRSAPTSALQLDVTVNAPNQVFIRGRGLDAELGGSVRLTGAANAIQPVGGFSLIRGRLAIMGQRITFETGSVTLVGDLDPFLDLMARTDGGGITVFVTVSGRASDIDVDFSSDPALPEDEVLSHLIFNRSMGELSPLQLARLAAAAAELAGGGTSLTESLRGAAGLADLDVITDESGNLAVRAGQYIQDNIYLGVQAGADGQSRVTVDLDLTEDIKARASTGVDGNSSVGIFYETDY